MSKLKISILAITLLVVSQNATARISVSDVIAIIQFVQDWVSSNPGPNTDEQAKEETIVVNYKWIGTYDYLSSPDGISLTGCSQYSRRSNYASEKWLLYVILIENRSTTPIYIQPDGFRLNALKNNKTVFLGGPYQKGSLPCKRLPGNRISPKIFDHFYQTKVDDIPIFAEGRFSGGILAPGMQMVGKHFFQTLDNRRKDGRLVLNFTDFKREYENGDFFVGSNAKIIYRVIPG